MGYYTSFTGALTFSRALNYGEVDKLESVEGADCFAVVKQIEDRATAEGVLSIITGHAIEPVTDDSMKAYDALEQLTRLAGRLPDDVTLAGEIRGEGADQGDVRRYVVSDGRVVELKPRMVWDDGYSEAPR